MTNLTANKDFNIPYQLWERIDDMSKSTATFIGRTFFEPNTLAKLHLSNDFIVSTEEDYNSFMQLKFVLPFSEN